MNFSRLESHVVGWTGFAVCLFHIHIRNLGIVAHHIQRTMSQQRLQGEYVTPGTEIGDREGVPEFVRVRFFHLSPGSQPVDQDPQAVLVERPVGLADEEGRASIFPVFTACQIAPDSFSSNFAQVDCAPFTTFGPPDDTMSDIDLSSLEVNIIDRQRTEFGCTQPGVQKVRMIA